MPTYAIGDIQGCFDELQDLLGSINFNPDQDTLWFAGDLVNRGPKSLETLRFIRNLKNKIVVLGNHDIYLLSLANGHPHKDHTLYDLLAAPDCGDLVNWLRKQPLFHYDATLNFAMSHAGIFPPWSLAQAQQYAREVEVVLQADHYATQLEYLYGNQPDEWDESLSGFDRLRFILNAFTRMRFCTLEGKLEFSCAGKIGTQPEGYLPWFAVPNRAMADVPIVFGHWSALEGHTNTPLVFDVDTGCVWGASLTALRLEDRQYFSVASKIKTKNLTQRRKER